MEKDPDMIWEGDFPYDVLAPAGITPDSRMSEVLDSMSYFTRRREGGRAQTAWKTLRVVKERLFVDFFLYRTTLPDSEPENQHG